MARVDALAACSESPRALTRRYLTPEHRCANARVSEWMRAAGMRVHIDAVGNVVGRYEASSPGAPALVAGSHLDTVRDAGRYDGMLGVVLPVACIGELHRRGERLPFAVEVVGFGDEEGVRFESTLLGSRAVAGTLDPALLGATDTEGMTLAQALREFGLDPARIGEAARRPQDVLGYLEVHIEQGPVLEAEGLPVGIVTTIAGATRLAVTLTGRAGHAGTVPMSMRRDALAASAAAVVAVERRCRAEEGLVGTVGRLEVHPGAVNVIPGEVRFTVDVRSADDARRAAAAADIIAAIEDIARERGVACAVRELHVHPSCTCSPWLASQLEAAVAAEGLTVRRLPSGAGHDAMALAALTDVAMLFVRCKEGVSHHPAESITTEDAAVAARVFLSLLRGFRPFGAAAASP
ncbi:MAG: allantoate amidohydrolase [Gammaproteobacteria bacterium]|nr:allantoate amidohydrolase [Gammaproteobacteria bacterium]NIR88821.1 allantoate amidohydrolase [Gammaproteobacteria bacterium]NIU06425.1 allantoate amidohydrolase [Gammaproteobacteria bacterium]NIV53317.1 allantoate amidohydrolase [Gammaproteobacteria bacterium]NIV74036.1 allantoate amidohydrolase [Gammaproteobacteria bacterium]